MVVVRHLQYEEQRKKDSNNDADEQLEPWIGNKSNRHGEAKPMGYVHKAHIVNLHWTFWDGGVNKGVRG